MSHFTRTHGDGLWKGVPPPTLNSPVTPNHGGFSTSTSFVVTGTHLLNTREVHFSGGAADPGFVVNNDGQLTVTTGSLNPPGAKDITVVTDSGTATLSAAFTFT